MKAADGKFEIDKPGLVHKDGTLYEFSDDGVMVLKVDEHGPRAWRKTVDVPRFVPCRAPDSFACGAARVAVESRLGGAEGDVFWKHKIVAEFLLERVPVEVVEVMAGYPGHQWSVCSLAMRAGGGDLARNNPGLALIIALNNVFMPKVAKPWRRARRLVGVKRRDVAGLAGFPAVSSSVKVLGKLDSRGVSPKSLFRLRWLMGDGGDGKVRDALRHSPYLDGTLLDALYYEANRRVVGLGLFVELSELLFRGDYSQNARLKYMLGDTLAMARQEDFEIRREIRSLAELSELHGVLTARLNALPFYERAFRGKIPPAPSDVLPDVESPFFRVKRLSSMAEFACWGRKQRNCVSMYTSKVAKDVIQIYKILFPEEATVSLRRLGGRAHAWEVSEIAGFQNSPISPETRRFVDRWVSGEGVWDSVDVDFPLPDFESERLSVERCFEWRDILDACVEGRLDVDIKDIYQRGKLWPYRVSRPERGFVVLGEVQGQLDVVAAVLDEGDVGSECGTRFSWKVLDSIDDWLWDVTPKGGWRQGRWKFEEG
jgi:hypothetical protein